MALSASLTAPQYDLPCDQGNDLDFAVVIQDDTGTPVALTGYIVQFTVKAGYAESAVALSAASNVVASSYITLDAPNGKATVHIDHADTALLNAPQSYVYDLKFTAPTGAETRKLYGAFYVKPQVTP